MFVHIGSDITVRSSSVIAVVNLEEVLPSQKDVYDFNNHENEINRLQYVTDDIPKTLVITDDRTYVCPLSSQVFLNRIIGDNYTQA